jgi:GNAT superfamily N-acetyltransferase
MSGFHDWWHRLQRRLRYAAAMQELTTLDPRTLKDCGLHRGDLHAIATAYASGRAYERLGHVRLRAVDPTDLASCIDFACRLRPEDIRSRFGRLVSLNDAEAFRRLFGIDDGKTRTIGLFTSREVLLAVGTIAPVQPLVAEIALIVRSDVQRQGLGATLMANVIRQARCSGFRLLSGYIDPANVPMRRLARRFGFELAGNSEARLEAQLLIEA